MLELKAIQFGILTYCKDKNFKHLRITSDNTTAISYINKKGGLKSQECNKIAKEIWICTSRDLHISAAHIPDKDNFEADKNSRKIYKAVCDICDTFATPEIDLFASRINRQTEKYVSWKPEPEAFAVDAFSINWSHHSMYIFPPFSLLTKVIKKISQDLATGILVFPVRSTRPWYTQVLKLSGKVPLKIRPNLTNLILPQGKAAVHPLEEQLTPHIIKFK